MNRVVGGAAHAAEHAEERRADELARARDDEQRHEAAEALAKPDPEDWHRHAADMRRTFIQNQGYPGITSTFGVDLV